MKCIRRKFNGTGAAVYCSIGFVPDGAILFSAGDAEAATAFFDQFMNVAAMAGGIMNHGGNQAVGLYAYGQGIEPYYGGDLLTAALQTSVTYGEGVYLGEFRRDMRMKTADGGDMVDARLDTWTLQTSANRTGKFNCDITGTYTGAGSRIMINGRWYFVEACTAGQGVSDNEVTLNYPVPSGNVDRIEPKWDLAPLAVGSTTSPGVKINATADVNVNDQMQLLIAWQYDD